MADRKSAYHSEMAKLFAGSRVRTSPKNQLIQYEGDRLTHVYLIEAGYVKVYTILDSGDMRTLLILGPGDIFPMVLATTDEWDTHEIRNFYQSLTDAKLRVVESSELKHKIDSVPAIKDLYYQYVTYTNRVILNQLEIMKSKKAVNKILSLLPYLINKLGQQIRPNVYQLRIKLSHQEIADLSGVTRETTTSLIKKLEKAGKLKQKKGKLVIKTGGSKNKKGE
jgi:CRP-like cAMP-binding protein